jgi:hypothetical protein
MSTCQNGLTLKKVILYNLLVKHRNCLNSEQGVRELDDGEAANFAFLKESMD